MKSRAWSGNARSSLSQTWRCCQYLHDWRVIPWHLLEGDHKNFFTRTSLRTLLQRYFRQVEIFSYGVSIPCEHETGSPCMFISGPSPAFNPAKGMFCFWYANSMPVPSGVPSASRHVKQAAALGTKRKEPLQARVAGGADCAAIVMPVDPKLKDPWCPLRVFRCEIGFHSRLSEPTREVCKCPNWRFQ